MRRTKAFVIQEPLEWHRKALLWANQYDICACTGSSNQNFPYGGFENLLAIGAQKKLIYQPGSNFEAFKDIYDSEDWLFGYFGYDLKNEIEQHLSSKKESKTGHPDIFFFIPKHIIHFQHTTVIIETVDNPESIFNEIDKISTTYSELPKASFNEGMTKQEYLNKVKKVQDHIVEGDIYEMNLCMEFWTHNIQFDPVEAYLKLTSLSPTPFAGFLKFDEFYLISASPERFLKKTGQKIISQPIKGTAKRSNDKEEDSRLKVALQHDEKERAENMMIVDLVRNDLTRSAQLGTTSVEEIFEVYTFKHWHQMISTISADVRENIEVVDIIKNAFPMGSMTGAPKIKVMELIEKYENTRRGVYSGAFGYIKPGGDFDFNVIIRSIMYNSSEKVANLLVGSAITYDSIPEQEYTECLLKARAIFDLFSSQN